MSKKELRFAKLWCGRAEMIGTNTIISASEITKLREHICKTIQNKKLKSELSQFWT
jgi:hypothetical protein